MTATLKAGIRGCGTLTKMVCGAHRSKFMCSACSKAMKRERDRRAKELKRAAGKRNEVKVLTKALNVAHTTIVRLTTHNTAEGATATKGCDLKRRCIGLAFCEFKESPGAIGLVPKKETGPEGVQVRLFRAADCNTSMDGEGPRCVSPSRQGGERNIGCVVVVHVSIVSA